MEWYPEADAHKTLHHKKGSLWRIVKLDGSYTYRAVKLEDGLEYRGLGTTTSHFEPLPEPSWKK
jgi:hypothetical protein